MTEEVKTFRSDEGGSPLTSHLSPLTSHNNTYLYIMKYVFLLTLICLTTMMHGQSESYKVSGTIVESASNQAIDYATVVVVDNATGETITGTTTKDGGKFEVITNTSNVSLKISFIGLASLTIDDLVFNGKSADLGKIYLGEDAKALDEIEITTEKSKTEFKLDKRIFNVGADLSSTGASALEVLNNVPSVNVNIEGQISLRGASGVQILINGKPSILADEGGNALSTITADMIDLIEVITNPSAKYEAEGTAGIINIVLKKNEKKGLNGSVTLNAGAPHNQSLGLSLNRRTEKFNLFSQLGVGYRELPRNNENINLDKINNTELRSIGEEFRNEVFYNLILGSDYYINPNNIITLSGSYALEIEDQPSETNFTFLSDGNVDTEWTRTEVTEATNPKYQYELKYKRDFQDNKDHQLLFSAIGSFFGKEQSSEFSNLITRGNGNYNDQTTATEFKEGKYTFNLDYTKPFNDSWTIETGAQYLINDVSNDYTVSDEINGKFVVDEGLTNKFEYAQKVFGVYGTASYEGKVWGIKLGLRAENTDLSTLLINTNEKNNQKFINLFPSAHSSYKLSEAVSLQVGYSRRIYRPKLWDLNPFFNIRNTFNIRAGNPNLQSEFTDSYELGSIFIYDKISLNINAYHRYTTDKIERVSTFIDNVNTYRPENIGINKATGLELNFKYAPIKKFTLNGDMNYNVFKRDGVFNDQIFDFSADKWTGKLTSKYKITKDIDVELTGQHESRERTVQGKLAANTYMDMGVKIKVLKGGKGVLNISVRDVFASRIRQDNIDNEDFRIYHKSQRGRFAALGFSYGFGKGEAMQYSGQRRR